MSHSPFSASAHTSQRVFLLGATGTIGQATVRALLRAGHEVVCFVRPRPSGGSSSTLPSGVTIREGDVRDPRSVSRDGLLGERFDAVLSCMASRTGAPRDTWAIDHLAHHHVLEAAVAAGIPHMVLLSAICVQKPALAFQHAKLAFERELMASPLSWSIVRPTAFFKSLSGQVERVRRGKPFLIFGDGTLTACKPISDDDLAAYLVECLTDPERMNQVLPIGGPGPALTAREQGELLFKQAGRPAKFSSVPVGMLSAIIGVLGTLGRIIPTLAEKAELARIGRYYATESMLVWNAGTGRYDAEATPSYGTDTLAEHYARLWRGEATAALGEHAVFGAG